MATKKSSTKKTASRSNTRYKKATYNAKKANTLSLILFAVGLLLIAFSIPFNTDAAGWVFIHELLCGLFGFAVFLVGPILIYFAIMLSLNRQGNLYNKLTLTVVFLLIICGLCLVFYKKPVGDGFIDKLGWLYGQGIDLKGGGLFSAIFGWSLISIFPQWMSALILILAAFVLFMIVSGLTLIQFFKAVSAPFVFIYRALKNLFDNANEPEQSEINDKKNAKEKESETEKSTQKKKDDERYKNIIANVEDTSMDGAENMPSNPLTKAAKGEKDNEPEEDTIDSIVKKAATSTPVAEKEEKPATPTVTNDEEIITKEEINAAKQEVTEEIENAEKIVIKEYIAPPVSLLAPPVKAHSKADVEKELKENAESLVSTLKSFGADTHVVNIERGPTVTRYELGLAQGTPIKKITNHADDIALNLASSGVRIEAPIPNKKAVGIEVPNEIVDVVTLSEIVGSKKFNDAKSPLTFAIGKDIAGDIVVGDIGKMPHLLIAGATGSGKSVCINSIIISLLYKANPGQVRLILIDPKVVELSIYNGIPHLLQPVVTDPRKAAGTLGWCVAQMEKRFRIFAENNVRDLNGYNEVAKYDDELEELPSIVIIIDELADLMMTTPTEVEDYICRLAQKARAAGMYLIIATQRPSADVITGTIKSNIPSRIAFKVADQINSRIILDQIGAEKLFGRGDMLYYPTGIPQPIRIQATFVGDKEVENIVEYAKQQALADYDEEMIKEMEAFVPQPKGAKVDTSIDTAGNSGSEDDELMRAIDIVVESDQASSSFLMRKMRFGYAKAARLIDQMEEMGIVGPLEGSKRKVIISKQQWYEMKMNRLESEDAAE